MTSTDVKKSTLTPAQQRLLEIMQRTNHGRIEGMSVRNGQPVFDPAPRVIRKIKIAGDNGPRPETAATDFALRKEVVEFFEHLDALGTGVVRCIEIKNGVPFSMDIEGTVQE